MKKIVIAVQILLVALLVLGGCDLINKEAKYSKVFLEIDAFFATINTNEIIEDIALPLESKEVAEAIIDWLSDNQSVITNEGVVNRTLEDTEVKLTASVEISEIIKKKTYTVTVLGNSDTVIKTPVFSGINDIDYIIGSGAIDYFSGVTATDYLGNDITSSIEVDSSQVNLTVVGEYEITYSVSDTEGNEATVSAYVNVKADNIDKTPIFTDINDINYIIGSGAIDYLLEVTATDYLGNDITSSIEVDSSQVNLTVVGEYEITYSVSDAEGNEATQNAYVNVFAAGEYDLISDVFAMPVGAVIEIRGMVTGLTRNDTFFVQDYSGGISIFDSGLNYINNLAFGDEVVVAGLKSQWTSGTTVNLANQINPTSVTKVDKTYNIAATTVSSFDKNRLADIEGSMISINGISLKDNFSAPSGDLNITLTDGNNDISLFVNRNLSGYSGIISKLTNVTSAFKIDLKNVIVSSFQSNLQLLCVNADQITLHNPDSIDPTVSYTIKYYGQNDQLLYTESVYKNATIVGPNASLLAVTDYQFAGWYLEASRTTSFNVNTQITKDYSLYGKWTKKTGNYDGNYYDGTDLTLSGDALEQALFDLIKSGNTSSYSSGKSRPTVAAADMVTGRGTLIIYGRGSSSIVYETGSDWNQEHVVPQSILSAAGHGGNTGDIHNLRACDYDVNSSRGNLRFVAGSGLYGRVSGGWYPGDDWIGDCARIVLYMATRYQSFEVSDIMSASLLVQWNAADPVDEFEINRNNIIFNNQKNRNPYIDHPELVEAVLGSGARQNKHAWHDSFADFINVVKVEYILPNKHEYQREIS